MTDKRFYTLGLRVHVNLYKYMYNNKITLRIIYNIYVLYIVKEHPHNQKVMGPFFKYDIAFIAKTN